MRSMEHGMSSEMSKPLERPERVEKNHEVKDYRKSLEQNDFYSSYKERLDHCPRGDGQSGSWSGERGESKYKPANKETQNELKRHGADGIEYKYGVPDFSTVAKESVPIKDMSDQRTGADGNFAKADQACADRWNKTNEGGKNDWTARDVSNWRAENKYTWHERNDRKTCDLVPTKVHEECRHLGGVSECKKEQQSQTKGASLFD